MNKSELKTSLPCTQCNAEYTDIYKFFYGKKGSESVSHGFTMKKTTTQFQIGGEQTISLCGTCVSKYRLKKLSSDFCILTVFFLFSLIVLEVLMVNVQMFDWGLKPILIALAIADALGLLGIAGMVLFKSKKDFGDNLAINNESKKFKSLGWDHFWTRKQGENFLKEVR